MTSYRGRTLVHPPFFFQDGPDLEPNSEPTPTGEAPPQAACPTPSLWSPLTSSHVSGPGSIRYPVWSPSLLGLPLPFNFSHLLDRYSTPLACLSPLPCPSSRYLHRSTLKTSILLFKLGPRPSRYHAWLQGTVTDTLTPDSPHRHPSAVRTDCLSVCRVWCLTTTQTWRITLLPRARVLLLDPAKRPSTPLECS